METWRYVAPSAGAWSMPGGLSSVAGTQNVVAGTFPTSCDRIVGTLAIVYGAVQDGSRPKKATSFVPTSESLGTGTGGPNMPKSRSCFSFDRAAS